jgi:hypothetical protein
MNTLASLSDHRLLLVGLISAAIALVGIVRDRMHTRRRDLDRVSLLPWGRISILALIVAIACIAIGVRTGA